MIVSIEREQPVVQPISTVHIRLTVAEAEALKMLFARIKIEKGPHDTLGRGFITISPIAVGYIDDSGWQMKKLTDQIYQELVKYV